MTFQMLVKPPEATRALTIGSPSRMEDLPPADSDLPITSLAIVPKGARLVAQYCAIVEEVQEDCVLAILTDSNRQEYSASFQVNEFLPGCSLCVGMRFDSFLYTLENGKERWVNYPQAIPNPDPDEIQAKMANLDAKFGDSGY